MIGEIFRINSVQITGKCIWETFIHPWDDLVFSPPMKNNPYKFTQKSLFPLWKAFYRKKSPLSHTLDGETLWAEKRVEMSSVKKFYILGHAASNAWLHMIKYLPISVTTCQRIKAWSRRVVTTRKAVFLRPGLISVNALNIFSGSSYQRYFSMAGRQNLLKITTK